MTEKEIQEKARAIAKEHEKYTEDCRIHLHHEGKSEVDVARETAYAAAIEMAEWKDEVASNDLRKDLAARILISLISGKGYWQFASDVSVVKHSFSIADEFIRQLK